jgi:Flp pilus assembly protein TadD
MSRHPESAGGRPDAAELKQELLGRLGLRADASEKDVEATHNGLVEFLELAPHEVRTWAADRTADVDEAFALLSGPEQDLVPAASVAVMAQDSLDGTPPTLSPSPAISSGFNTSAAPPAAPAKTWATTALASAKPQKKKLLGAGVAVLVVAVVVGVFFMGKSSDVPGITGTPTAASTTAPSNGPTAVPVDPAKVTALMTKIAANPKDRASLQALGDIYFAANDYKNAIVWEQKVVAVDPKNQVGLLSLGAAQFNLGNSAEAKKEWLIAAGLYPKVAEVHYDLGFLYMSATPPDTANMNAEWKKVVDIDPNSNLAKTVATHMASATPTASASPSAK